MSSFRVNRAASIGRAGRQQWAQRIAGVLLATAGCIALLGTWKLAIAAESQARVDADGTLHTDSITIPPSSLWSPQFKAFYAKFAVAKFVQPFFETPAMDAPEEEWDKLAVWNEKEIAEPLAWVRAHYPAEVEDTRIAGVHVGIITPRNGVAARNEHRVLINLRGGGFVFNRGLSWGQLESMPVASIGGMKVITVDYRQAPQYRYPAATEDVEAVYRELLKRYSPQAIGIYGCSAGGMLTGQAAAWFQSKGLPRPGAIGILCATVGPIKLEGDSSIWGAGPVPADPKAGMKAGWYMGTADVTDPAAYPGVSDSVLAKFPPTLLLVGTREAAISPVLTTHARLLKLGVDSSLYVMEGAPHAAHVLAVGTPEAHEANAYIAKWFDQHLSVR